MLSKSDYLLFLRHPAWLWLKKYDKSKLPAITDRLQSLFDEGFEFEAWAEKLFPGAVRIEKGSYQDYLTQPARTKTALEAGATTLFQGRFETAGITCISDVLEVVGENTVDITEIKSSTEVKKTHLHDLAFQTRVLEVCGYRVRNLRVLCVNTEYVRQGEIDPAGLVKSVDVTADVKALGEETKVKIALAAKLLETHTCPDITPSNADPDGFRDWLEVYRGLVPVPEDSILELTRINRDLYQELESRGITMITEIPDSIMLGKQQRWQVTAAKENRVMINPDAIRKFLAGLVFPLYFLDYETFSGVIPEFDGVRPYQQVPFQYSLHVLSQPDGELLHFRYLHTEHSHPVLPLTESLQKHIGESGSVLVWYEGFEKGRNTEMGCTNADCSVFYEKLNSRIVDLMTPFAEGWYADKRFKGSASIKNVLPVLVPDLSYKTLNIQEGASAQRLWMDAVFAGKGDLMEKGKLFADLDAYCTLDTMAMVEIYRQLVRVSGRHGLT